MDTSDARRFLRHIAETDGQTVVGIDQANSHRQVRQLLVLKDGRSGFERLIRDVGFRHSGYRFGPESAAFSRSLNTSPASSHT